MTLEERIKKEAGIRYFSAFDVTERIVFKEGALWMASEMKKEREWKTGNPEKEGEYEVTMQVPKTEPFISTLKWSKAHGWCYQGLEIFRVPEGLVLAYRELDEPFDPSKQ